MKETEGERGSERDRRRERGERDRVVSRAEGGVDAGERGRQIQTGRSYQITETEMRDNVSRREIRNYKEKGGGGGVGVEDVESERERRAAVGGDFLSRDCMSMHIHHYHHLQGLLFSCLYTKKRTLSRKAANS